MLSAGEGARRLRRQHGFQLPLHPFQLSGWLTLAVLAAGSFLLLVPALPLHAQPAALAALSALLLLHLVAHLSAALVDPAEAALRHRRPEPVPQLDRNKHAHVIESGFCHLCNIQTSSQRTKHCSACNKCVAAFDHHCKWLNHCIGSRNYGLFLMCITTAVAAASLVAALAVVELVLHHNYFWYSADSSNEKLIKDLNETNFTTTSTPLPNGHSSSLPSSDAAFLAVVVALGLLAAITAGLLLHLCFFHIYISFLGLTTYEYIRQQRDQSNNANNTHNNQVDNENRQDDSHLRHRPVNLHCNGGSGSRTTFLTCTFFEETFSNCCQTAEPTPTPPTTPQDCQMCIFNNQVAPADVQRNYNAAIGAKKLSNSSKKKWNCCVSVPDSPDDPAGLNNSPVGSEPRCLMSLCRYNKKVQNNKKLPALEGRPHRTHGHWSSAKLRMLFRVLGNLGQNRRRPPSTDQNQETIQTVSNLVPVPCYPDVGNRRANALPSLPAPPPRRRIISETELANALTLLQQQQQYQQQRCGGGRSKPIYRKRRRSIAHRTKTPKLSPIRESGLSNPASPSRQSCAVTLITGDSGC